jgi:hypothetical protein
MHIRQRNAIISAVTFVAVLLLPAASMARPTPTGASPPHPVLTAVAYPSPSHYTVHRGDTLSKIALHLLGSKKLWPLLWWENRQTVHNPNMLLVGTRLRYDGKRHVSSQVVLRAYRAIPRPKPAPVAASPVQSAPVASAPAPVVQSYSGGSGFQACVIARESGGNPNAWNPNGHYGLYQFSAGTWAANGGNPADFGHASVAEQNQVFANTMATGGGASNWSPYDGC